MSPASSPDPARLANASVGKNYEFSLKTLLGLHDNSIQIEDVCVTFNTPCGLEFDPETLVLRGVPTVAGELSVDVTYRTSTYKKAALTINPDPSSLWKNLPSDPDGKFAMLDEECAYLESPSLKICAASLRGRSHAHEGKYRDDNFAMRYLEESQWHLMVVADGAGSAKYSRRGSKLACEITMESLSRALTGADNKLDQALLRSEPDHFSLDERSVKVNLYTTLIHAAWDARKAIEDEAKSTFCESKDFHTTTLLVIAKKFSFGWFFASFSVGDGGMGIFVDETNVKLLNSPDSGDFGGQTLFLTHPKAFSGDNEALIERLKFHVVTDFRWLALMTDGITDPKFPSDQELSNPSTWAHLEAELASSLEFGAITENSSSELLRWMQFPSPGNHDDRTVILAVPFHKDEVEVLPLTAVETTPCSEGVLASSDLTTVPAISSAQLVAPPVEAAEATNLPAVPTRTSYEEFTPTSLEPNAVEVPSPPLGWTPEVESEAHATYDTTPSLHEEIEEFPTASPTSLSQLLRPSPPPSPPSRHNFEKSPGAYFPKPPPFNPPKPPPAPGIPRAATSSDESLDRMFKVEMPSPPPSPRPLTPPSVNTEDTSTQP